MSAIDPDLGPIPHLVDTQSDDFRVYSPRKSVPVSSELSRLTFSFPGLPKPTELAEHFALQGYKLNTRKVRHRRDFGLTGQNERQQASPNPSPPP